MTIDLTAGRPHTTASTEPGRARLLSADAGFDVHLPGDPGYDEARLPGTGPWTSDPPPSPSRGPPHDVSRAGPRSPASTVSG